VNLPETSHRVTSPWAKCRSGAARELIDLLGRCEELLELLERFAHAVLHSREGAVERFFRRKQLVQDQLGFPVFFLEREGAHGLTGRGRRRREGRALCCSRALEHAA